MRFKPSICTIVLILLPSLFLFFHSCEEPKQDEFINNPPNCIITSPTNDSKYSQGESISISAEVDDVDNNLEKVVFYINDIEITTLYNSPYEIDWVAGENDFGPHTIKIVAIDKEQVSKYDDVFIKINGTVTDSDGNEYPTIKIGDQIWMGENLKTKTYNDGTPIILVTNEHDWYREEGVYCYSDFDEDQNADIYGALYNWYAVNTEKLCPDGWHIPSDAEWLTLKDFVSSDGHGQYVGKALKSTTGWDDYKMGNGLDSYDFTALPGGQILGGFWGLGYFGYWWSSTEYLNYYGHYVSMGYSYDQLYDYHEFKEFGFSVRCIKD